MIRNAYNRIYSKLKNNSAYRDNDKLLILDVWRDEGLRLNDEQERAFMQVTSPETIRRTRQKIQSDGHFKASKNIHEKRKEAEYQTRSEVVNDRVVQQNLRWLFEPEEVDSY